MLSFTTTQYFFKCACRPVQKLLVSTDQKELLQITRQKLPQNPRMRPNLPYLVELLVVAVDTADNLILATAEFVVVAIVEATVEFVAIVLLVVADLLIFSVLRLWQVLILAVMNNQIFNNKHAYIYSFLL